ncbi:translation initiation factor IF-2 subunit beta [Candidatus Pacearchaeota archaeon]|nr:translation initiation factor IF-2 subunit beta [Candidatus Pacearchaeota archaeon]
MSDKEQPKQNQEDYELLLAEAYKKIKPVESKIDRFETPKVEGHLEGTKTIITNFKQICSYIRRDQDHVLKYLLKELATPGVMKGDRLVLTRTISSKLINEKIALYVQDYVICKECKKPDTEITRDDRLTFLHCLACGAKKPITKI